MEGKVLSRVAKVSAGLFCAGWGSAWWYRPLQDQGSNGKGNGPSQNSVNFVSRRNLNETADRKAPLPLELFRQISVSITTAFFNLVLKSGGDVEIHEDENYTNFLEKVKSRDDSGLLTVSNHRSLLDDPGLMACLLPFWMGAQPKYQRWSVCSQEYCFNDSLPSLIHAYFGAGKVLPIKRGAGINQRLLLDFSRHLAAGDWCHIFPEGGVWQNVDLGGRGSVCDLLPFADVRIPGTKAKISVDSDEFSKQVAHRQSLGRLKWGAGKMIAHAPVPPVVIPFVHHGMEEVIPELPGEKRVAVWIPRVWGHTVSIRFGEEICFEDLISEHEKTHGPLWKYASNAQNDSRVQDALNAGYPHNPGAFHRAWDSTDAEKELYHKICTRIEERLTELNILCLEDRAESISKKEDLFSPKNGVKAKDRAVRAAKVARQELNTQKERAARVARQELNAQKERLQALKK